MPARPEDFSTFLDNISISKAQLDACRAAHKEVNTLLLKDPDTSPVIVGTFIQGSLKRGTCVRAHKDQKSDVDLVVATALAEEDHSPPALAWERFAPLLEANYGPQGKRWRAQERSVRLLFPGRTKEEEVELDLVVTSAPSKAILGLLQSDRWLLDDDPDPLATRIVLAKSLREAAKDSTWKLEPLRIPDRGRKVWEDTHPLAQIAWSSEKNGATNGHYTHVVQSLKWWQRACADFGRPKGYTLEAIVAACCPDGITNLGEGIALTLKRIVDSYARDVLLSRVPEVPDMGTGQNVLSRVTFADFAVFYRCASEAARVAQEAAEVGSRERACGLWRQLFGLNFPDYRDPAPPPRSGGGFEAPRAPAVPTPSRFA